MSERITFTPLFVTTSTPEQVMTQLKAYSSRRLNEVGLDDRVRKRWTRHGSTRYLWRDEDVWSAVRYVVHRQGTPMSVFVSEEYAIVGPDPGLDA